MDLRLQGRSGVPGQAIELQSQNRKRRLELMRSVCRESFLLARMAVQTVCQTVDRLSERVNFAWQRLERRLKGFAARAGFIGEIRHRLEPSRRCIDHKDAPRHGQPDKHQQRDHHMLHDLGQRGVQWRRSLGEKPVLQSHKHNKHDRAKEGADHETRYQHAAQRGQFATSPR